MKFTNSIPTITKQSSIYDSFWWAHEDLDHPINNLDYFEHLQAYFDRLISSIQAEIIQQSGFTGKFTRIEAQHWGADSFQLSYMKYLVMEQKK